MKFLKSLTNITLIISILILCQIVSNASVYPLKVKDSRNKTIIIPKEPKRIISLAPNNTEILYAIGAGAKIVGVNSWSNYPAEAKKRPSIGDRVISIEKVMSLRPDLVLAHGTINDDAVRALEMQKIKVFAIDPKTINQLAKDISIIGKIINSEKTARTLSNTILKTKAEIFKKSKTLKKKPKVLFSIQSDPLWVAGKNTFVDEIIRLCGGINIAADGKGGFSQYSIEMAIRHNPDIIITTSKGDKRIFTNKQWMITNGAKKGRVYEIDPDIIVRPAPRIVTGMKKISQMVNPDAK